MEKQKQFKLPYETLISKLVDKNLVETPEEIAEKWIMLQKFNQNDFTTIVLNTAEGLKDKLPLLTESAIRKIIDGSLENFYYIREYAKSQILDEKYYK